MAAKILSATVDASCWLMSWDVRQIRTSVKFNKVAMVHHVAQMLKPFWTMKRVNQTSDFLSCLMRTSKLLSRQRYEQKRHVYKVATIRNSTAHATSKYSLSNTTIHVQFSTMLIKQETKKSTGMRTGLVQQGPWSVFRNRLTMAQTIHIACHVQITPQILKVHPEGVISLLYLSEISPVLDTYRPRKRSV